MARVYERVEEVQVPYDPDPAIRIARYLPPVSLNKIPQLSGGFRLENRVRNFVSGSHTSKISP